ncbi:phage holin, partial [Bifidobacterium longum]
MGLIVLPALALFVSTVGPAWGWTHVDAIVTRLNALGIPRRRAHRRQRHQ